MSTFDSKSSVQRKSAPGAQPAAAPGVQLKSNGYVQQKAEVSPEGAAGYDVQRKEASPDVQMRGPGLSGAGVQAAAAKGVSGGGGQIPHHDAIQASFGSDHDVGAIDSHVGGAAADASKAMGAQAYATGNSVAFSSAPDLHTAAHEAAHVQQQKAGVVQLKGGVGEAGDAYEKNADEVADRVVQGKSAADLLPGGAGGGGGGVQQKQGPVQMLGDSLDAEVSDENRPNDSLDYHRRNDDTGEWENKPMEGEVSQYDYSARKNKTVQRRYTFGQYQAMWEKERGRPMNETELATLNRGCIGITVLNLGGSGNPPLDEAYNTFDQGHARMEDLQKTIKEHPDMSAADAQAAGFNVNFSGKLGDYKSVMFAKLFWSNQQAKPSQEAFNAGSHEWNDEHKWEKASLVLPNGLTVEAMMKDQGRQAVIDYVYNDLGKDEFQRLTKANHDANVSAYYLAWARAMEDKDPDRFPVDEATGKVDMSGYLYQSRPKIKKNKESGQDEYSGGYVNFDYGFWDDGSNCFWHANHMQYPEGDERRDKQPMIVLQSTREKFIKGYFDFDRVIFCVGLTKGYDPASAADTHQ